MRASISDARFLLNHTVFYDGVLSHQKKCSGILPEHFNDFSYLESPIIKSRLFHKDQAISNL